MTATTQNLNALILNAMNNLRNAKTDIEQQAHMAAIRDLKEELHNMYPGSWLDDDERCDEQPVRAKPVDDLSAQLNVLKQWARGEAEGW